MADQKPLCDSDCRVFADKERLRAQDREAIASGRRSPEEANRANAIVAPVVHLYRPSMKLGFPR